MEDVERVWFISFIEEVGVSNVNEVDKRQHEEKERPSDIDLPRIWGVHNAGMFIWVQQVQIPPHSSG